MGLLESPLNLQFTSRNWSRHLGCQLVLWILDSQSTWRAIFNKIRDSLLEVRSQKLLDTLECDTGSQLDGRGRSTKIVYDHALKPVSNLYLVLQPRYLLGGLQARPTYWGFNDISVKKHAPVTHASANYAIWGVCVDQRLLPHMVGNKQGVSPWLSAHWLRFSLIYRKRLLNRFLFALNQFGLWFTISILDLVLHL